jgi:hypothetical protein
MQIVLLRYCFAELSTSKMFDAITKKGGSKKVRGRTNLQFNLNLIFLERVEFLNNF